MFIADDSSEPQSVVSEIQERAETDSDTESASSDSSSSDVERYVIPARRSSGCRRNLQPPNISNIGFGMSSYESQGDTYQSKGNNPQTTNNTVVSGAHDQGVIIDSSENVSLESESCYHTTKQEQEASR